MLKFFYRLGLPAVILTTALSFSAPVTAQDATGGIVQPETTTPVAARTTKTTRAGGGYFVEFRSRYALSYGHTFAMHGRLNARGQIIESDVAGLHPAGDSPVPWMIGHLIPVPSETGPSDGDLEEKYVSARYRVVLNAEQYQKVSAYIKQLQGSSPIWNAVTYNCNAFVADIAKFMGLDVPSSTMLYPADYINSLRKINTGRSVTIARS